uniref:hypothetical protein n=1 Tax=Acetatifactor sp. TaxID=1872090 RepID=UPI0040576B90
MSSTRTKVDLVTMEEWKELGEMLKDWEPYTELVAKRSKGAAEQYMQRMYGMDCSQRKKVDFYINKVVYRALMVMTYRSEIINLGLWEGDEVRRRITGEIDRLLLQGRGEFSKKPVRKMRESDGRMLELCRKYLKSIGMWTE